MHTYTVCNNTLCHTDVINVMSLVSLTVNGTATATIRGRLLFFYARATCGYYSRVATIRINTVHVHVHVHVYVHVQLYMYTVVLV